MNLRSTGVAGTKASGLTTRCNLATAYYSAGRLTDVVAVLQRALSDCERYLGPDHQMTQTVRETLDAATQA